MRVLKFGELTTRKSENARWRGDVDKLHPSCCIVSRYRKVITWQWSTALVVFYFCIPNNSKITYLNV